MLEQQIHEQERQEYKQILREETRKIINDAFVKDCKSSEDNDSVGQGEPVPTSIPYHSKHSQKRENSNLEKLIHNGQNLSSHTGSSSDGLDYRTIALDKTFRQDLKEILQDEMSVLHH